MYDESRHNNNTTALPHDPELVLQIARLQYVIHRYELFELLIISP